MATASRSRLHPLVAAAATAVIVLSFLQLASLTGLIHLTRDALGIKSDISKPDTSKPDTSKPDTSKPVAVAPAPPAKSAAVSSMDQWKAIAAALAIEPQVLPEPRVQPQPEIQDARPPADKRRGRETGK